MKCDTSGPSYKSINTYLQEFVNAIAIFLKFSNDNLVLTAMS